ncbi:glycosyltransferase [Pseudoalteromonas luteoviolacea]|uniref:glycosyltransferase family 4 protein n=1 Tax=Pseudoalteromonas luteoviolacea TaxID=43657 RepID=UPI001F3458EF|nr:glycosyltransferase [Pseudoalteromonas luteoviolacea]MCF6442829.1 glycosyltransferase [Pseudoalteromonas luteoviolacea]
MKHIGIYTTSRKIDEVAMMLSEANALADIGHKVTIITRVKYKNIRNLHKSVSVAYLGSPSLIESSGLCSTIGYLRRCYAIWKQFKGQNFFDLLGEGTKLTKLLKKKEIDHLHCSFNQSDYYISLASTKCVDISLSSFWDVKNENRIGKKQFKLFEQCDLPLMELECQRPPEHVQPLVLNRGLDITKYKPYERNKPSLQLIFIGNIVKESGLNVILNALASLPARVEVNLDIIGDGPIKKALVNELIRKRLNRRVHFLGAKPRSWILKNLPKYSAIVAPYCSDNSIAQVNNITYIKEAMACGLPVLTSNIAACKEITSSNTGMKCPPNSIDAMSNMLTAFMQLSAYHQHLLGKNARKYAEDNFNVKHQTRALSRWIQAL